MPEPAHRDVVVGVDTRHPLLEFAFAAAEQRGATLSAVHAWSFPVVWAMRRDGPGVGAVRVSGSGSAGRP